MDFKLNLTEIQLDEWKKMPPLNRSFFLFQWQSVLLGRYHALELALQKTGEDIARARAQSQKMSPECWADCPAYQNFREQVMRADETSKRRDRNIEKKIDRLKSRVGYIEDSANTFKKKFKKIKTQIDDLGDTVIDLMAAVVERL